MLRGMGTGGKNLSSTGELEKLERGRIKEG